MREEWASIIAHDLRQPINAVVFWTTCSPAPGRRNTRSRCPFHAAMALSRLVNDLTDAS